MTLAREIYAKDNKEIYNVDEIFAVPDTNILFVNIELTKIKITVVINLKWFNLDYPCYLVGRPQVTFPVTTTLGGVRVHD